MAELAAEDADDEPAGEDESANRGNRRLNPPSAATLLQILGDELRQARCQRGWIRKDVQERLTPEISLQTLATYELGTRGIGVVRLVDLCAALEVNAAKLLDRVLRRVNDDAPSVGQLEIDLRKVLLDEQAALLPLRRWAELKLGNNPKSPVAGLSRPALERLAELCHLDLADLVSTLQSLEARTM